MKTLTSVLRSAALLLTSLALLVGCGGGDDFSTASVSTATLKLSITDAPARSFDNVIITVKEIRVHQSGDAVESNDAGWQVIPPVNAPRRIDLLELPNGVLAELGQTVLPAGKYTQMRLILAENNI